MLINQTAPETALPRMQFNEVLFSLTYIFVLVRRDDINRSDFRGCIKKGDQENQFYFSALKGQRVSYLIDYPGSQTSKALQRGCKSTYMTHVHTEG